MANKTKASTQQHLDIDDIVENLVLLKTGNVAMIMITTAVNFDILSEAEQDATIYAYGALLNSLSFPTQILIRSKRADISAYFAHLNQSLTSQTNPDLKHQIQKYMEFIQATVQQRTVLDKKFYLIINFSTLELGIGGITKSKGTKSQNRAQLIADAKIGLGPKRDHLIKQTARLGLTTRQLTTKELIELFYDIYNPATTGTQKVIIDEGSYSVPIVEPAIEVPTPAPLPNATAPVADGTQAVAQAQSKLPIQNVPIAPLGASFSNQKEAYNNLQSAAAKAKEFLQASSQPATQAKGQQSENT
ncbi:hypothetical protein A3A60_03050 [Candidatus Curtissbacteria bacterium RIFCSPLOWO2_01_FULL_42_26]|uniref:Uncharacterized protein n=1 Tax=Candidatus Curtissbacteria bacterium RIFCSPLOWO2_01_FULL_42_26 TaxID=1797729 RepID=A0A1F5I2K3_9BACT|nr:MAG: hypothetical protein A3A60_03050 [Candidatus Curtissbacteria bacterium RIFCSPLOWO2_01_FULL_42_26]